MNVVPKQVDAEIRLKKAHIKLIKHPETCLYGGVILMGESSVIDDPKKCPTAYTDGYNKRYGRDFLDKLSDAEIAGLVLHENLHVLMKHIPRHRDLNKENKMLANVAMDYAVNDIIVELSKAHPTLAVLPKGGLYDPMFQGWSVRRIYEYLKQEAEGNGGSGGCPRGQPLDEHDGDMFDNMNEGEQGNVKRDIDDAIHQGGILAGKFGAKIPRVIKELMAPQVDWREVLQEFWVSSVRGADELTWRRFNKHRLADDYYLPSSINETVGEVILAIDTSGSISNDDIGKVATHIRELCESVTPERIRVLWWDTKVHGEQVFEGNYENITSLLKPMGGGGTRVSSVSDYILNKNLTADCVIVFTDGYLEDDIKWRVDIPALWLITQGGSRSFVPPRGGKIQIND
jgi:predicted metal-dependent peptidase